MKCEVKHNGDTIYGLTGGTFHDFMGGHLWLK